MRKLVRATVQVNMAAFGRTSQAGGLVFTMPKKTDLKNTWFPWHAFFEFLALRGNKISPTYQCFTPSLHPSQGQGQSSKLSSHSVAQYHRSSNKKPIWSLFRIAHCCILPAVRLSVSGPVFLVPAAANCSEPTLGWFHHLGKGQKKVDR